MNPKDTKPPSGGDWAKNLDDKERLFVEGYLQTLNKRKAARYAGYTDASAARYAYEIFNRPNVREAIESCLRNRTGITKPWIVDKLAPIIDTNLADIGSWDADGTFVLLPSDDLTDEQKVAVSEVVTEYGRTAAPPRSSYTTSWRQWRSSRSCSTCLLIVRNSAAPAADLSG